jgi:hypothetical protein
MPDLPFLEHHMLGAGQCPLLSRVALQSSCCEQRSRTPFVLLGNRGLTNC